MRTAADSSVAIAALLEDHPDHDAAAATLADCDTTIAHVASETYSVLTRLPAPHRADAASAAAVLARRLRPAYVTLAPDLHAQAFSRLASVGVSGGATYDGLIALTAIEHDVRLLSRDARAARAYRALGVDFTLMS